MPADDNALGNHEGGIKSDAELADQAGAILGLVEPRQEGFGAGSGDGAEIVDQFLPVHSDAAVDDESAFGFLSGRSGFSAIHRLRSGRDLRSP